MIEEHKLRQFTRHDPIYLHRPVPSERSATGYLGRTTIMEFLTMTDPIRRLVMQHADQGKIEALAREEGMRTMYEDGIAKALTGDDHRGSASGVSGVLSWRCLLAGLGK